MASFFGWGSGAKTPGRHEGTPGAASSRNASGPELVRAGRTAIARGDYLKALEFAQRAWAAVETRGEARDLLCDGYELWRDKRPSESDRQIGFVNEMLRVIDSTTPVWRPGDAVELTHAEIAQAGDYYSTRAYFICELREALIRQHHAAALRIFDDRAYQALAETPREFLSAREVLHARSLAEARGVAAPF